MRRRHLLLALPCALLAAVEPVRAQQGEGEAEAVLELRYTPAPRAQIAIWIEDGTGRFIRTLSLTDAVGYRGIGNRPGASLMNSGYRWPYGRREGVLPLWARRRASAPGAEPWRRVIFQDRASEGDASRTSADHSVDDYYCLSFDKATTTRDALDAVSCASVFTSDKGRFITDDDEAEGYAEPWQDVGADNVGHMQRLSIHSLYPPRMDVERCSGTECYDHSDIDDYAAHARDVMPEIDAVTTATPPGFTEQSVLFSVPTTWPKGSYAILLEINVEGDYNDQWDASTYQTPTVPNGQWDIWAVMYGYPYRGQPSVLYRVPFELDEVGEVTYGTETASGRSSWSYWDSDYGELEPLEGMSDDPEGAAGSGLDRLQRDADGQRVVLRVETLSEPPLADPDMDPFVPPPDEMPDPEPGSGGMEPSTDGPDEPGVDDGDEPDAMSNTTSPSEPPLEVDDKETDAVILADPVRGLEGPVGPVRGLRLGRHGNLLHAHEWVTIRFRAVHSDLPLHEYEVRVSSKPITDEATFIRHGRAAKTATTSAEGAVKLMLGTDASEGDWVDGEIGGLVALTEHFIAVRARDRQNRAGPISVARITTPRRTFSTVTPCFIATAAYGTALAGEVGVLRGLRDRYLASHALGRAFVAAYYDAGPRLGRALKERPWLRTATRTVLAPLVALARWLDSP